MVWFGQVTTPLVFKMIPAVVHLGILLKWFSPDSTIEVSWFDFWLVLSSFI